MKKNIFVIVNLLFLLCAYVSAQDVFIYNEKGDKEYFKMNNGVKYVKLAPYASNLHSLLSLVQKVDTVMPDMLKLTLKESDKDIIGKMVSETDGVFVADELTYTKDGTVQMCN